MIPLGIELFANLSLVALVILLYRENRRLRRLLYKLNPRRNGRP